MCQIACPQSPINLFVVRASNASSSVAMSSSFSNHQFPMERVLYNLHHKCCIFALQNTSHRSRRLVEHSILIFAVCCFGALLLAHLTFIQKGTRSNIPTICLNSIPGFDKDAAVTHLTLIEDGYSTVVSTHRNERRRRRRTTFARQRG